MTDSQTTTTTYGIHLLSDEGAVRTGPLVRGLSTLRALVNVGADIVVDDPAGLARECAVYQAIVNQIRSALDDDLVTEFDVLFTQPAVADHAALRVTEQSLIGWSQVVFAQQSEAFAPIREMLNGGVALGPIHIVES